MRKSTSSYIEASVIDPQVIPDNNTSTVPAVRGRTTEDGDERVRVPEVLKPRVSDDLERSIRSPREQSLSWGDVRQVGKYNKAMAQYSEAMSHAASASKHAVTIATNTAAIRELGLRLWEKGEGILTEVEAHRLRRDEIRQDRAVLKQTEGMRIAIAHETLNQQYQRVQYAKAEDHADHTNRMNEKREIRADHEARMKAHDLDVARDLKVRRARVEDAGKEGVVDDAADGWSENESETSGTSYGDGSSQGDQAGWQFTPHVGEDGQGRYLASPSISGGMSSSATRSDATSASAARTAGASGSVTRSRTETTSESETTQMHIVSAREQVFVDAQHLLSFDMQRHDAVVRWEDRDGHPKAALVKVSPFRKQPSQRDGRPVLQQYRAAVARFTRRSARTPYKATGPSVPDVIETATTDIDVVSEVRSAPTRTSPSSRPVEPPRVDLFPPRPGDLIEREMRAVYALEAVATIHLCTVQILMLLFDWSYDKAYRELEGLVEAGHVDRIRGFAPRGEGSVPTTYVINGNGASALAEHGRDREELHRVAKNLGVYRRAVEENRPTQERHRMYSAMLATILIASARSIDRDATVSDLRFDRERVIPVDLASVGEIPTRDRALVNPDPSKQTVSYVPDFSFIIRWTIDGKPRTEAIFGEVETGFGERDAHDLAVGKAWKIRALLKLFETRFTLGDHTFEADAMPRIVVWSRTAPLEQRFFEGASSVFKDRMSPFWFTHGELLPLAIPTGTAKKGIAAEARKLVENVQHPVWRWLRFPDANDRRRFVGVRRSA